MASSISNVVQSQIQIGSGSTIVGEIQGILEKPRTDLLRGRVIALYKQCVTEHGKESDVCRGLSSRMLVWIKSPLVLDLEELFSAARNGDVESIKTVLNQKDIVISEINRGLAVSVAARNISKVYLKHQKDHGWAKEFPWKESESLVETVGELLKSGKIPLTYRSMAIKSASQNGFEKIVVKLLEVPAGSAASESISNEVIGKVIKTAAQGGCARIVDSILSKRFVSESDLREAFMIAVENGHVDILRLLFPRPGLKMSAEDQINACTIAVEDGSLDIIKLFSQFGFFPENFIGNLIKSAAQDGRLQIIKSLISVVSPSDLGEAVMIAAEHGNHIILESLLGIDNTILISSADRGQAIEIAFKNKHPMSAAILMRVWTQQLERELPSS